MIEVGTYEAETRLPELLEKVGAGEAVRITRRGEPVARIVADEEALKAGCCLALPDERRLALTNRLERLREPS